MPTTDESILPSAPTLPVVPPAMPSESPTVNVPPVLSAPLSPPPPAAAATPGKKKRPKADVTLELPAVWLANIDARKEIFDEKHLRALGKGAWLKVFLVLLRMPREIERARFSIEHWDDEVLPGMSRLEWLVELGRELDKIPEDIRLERYLSHKYGDVHFEISNGKTIEFHLNEMRFAYSFVVERFVEFDNDTKVFRRYCHETGIWRLISDEWGRRLLMEYAVPYIKENPALYRPRHYFFRDVFENCRPLGLPDEEDLFDAYNILGVKNGAIALKTNTEAINGRSPDEEVHHAACSPAHVVRNVIPVNYDKTKLIPTKFLAFLNEMMPSDDVTMLQQWCGMVLLGKNYFHRIMIISGETNSGKSTLINLIEKMVGYDNVATLNTARLEERFELSSFFEKTLLVGKDVGSDFLSKKSAHMLKSLSGDCGIKAELKYVQQRVRLAGPFNIVMVSNADLHLELQGDAGAWDRRLLVINIARKSPIAAKIQDLEDKLIRDEGSAILNWMLRGAKDILAIRRLGKDFPRTTRQSSAVAQLLGRSDPVGDFVKCELAPGGPSDGVTSEELYVAYLNYCARAGVDPLPATFFQKRVGRPIYDVHRGESTMFKAGADRNAKRGYSRVKVQVPVQVPACALTDQQISSSVSESPQVEAKQENGYSAIRQNGADPAVAISAASV